MLLNIASFFDFDFDQVQMSFLYYQNGWVLIDILSCVFFTKIFIKARFARWHHTWMGSCSTWVMNWFWRPFVNFKKGRIISVTRNVNKSTDSSILDWVSQRVFWKHVTRSSEFSIQADWTWWIMYWFQTNWEDNWFSLSLSTVE